ncbi:Alpha-mannosidase 2C1 [Entophlyctis luteolus]|nr:Alpha-mannosidase 2C1 [Entophlyctis luteolus]
MSLQKHYDITVRRLTIFSDFNSQFRDVNLATAQWSVPVSDDPRIVSVGAYVVPNGARIRFADAVKANYKPAHVNDAFGPSLTTVWFKVNVAIPRDQGNVYNGKEVAFLFDASNEAMVWTKEGIPVTGLTGGTGDDRHVDFTLTKSANPGDKFEFYLEMACNNRMGIVYDGAPDYNRYWTLNTAGIAVPNRNGQLLKVYFDVMLQLIKDTPREWQINSDALYYANKIVNIFRPHDGEALQKALGVAVKFFEDRRNPARKPNHEIYAIGNCHIDTAWLWPYDETKRKAGRSWARQIMLMKSNPNFTFTASQAQQYEWVEQLYPTIFKDMQEFAERGQFLPAGGTWVEMDCNMPSARDISKVALANDVQCSGCLVWKSLDTFGYSSQLPQISNSAGMKFFFTQKISWNNINKFPHTTFMWAGLDNSEVLTHFAASETYQGMCTPGELVKTVHNNKDKTYANKSIYLFGHGDGGGGALPAMLDRLDILSNIEGLPASVQFCDPAAFYKTLEGSCHALTRWKGELYFELHRGTYTTHARIKKFNRDSENLLREIEYLSVLALLMGNSTSFEYPTQELSRIWKLVLLNQFHDVLPGSSIGLVYEDATKFYLDVAFNGLKLKELALAALGGAQTISAVATVLNVTSWPLNCVLELDASHSLISNELQVSADGKQLCFVQSLPGMAASPLNPTTMGFIPVTDMPTAWDAWDVEVYHLQKGFNVPVGTLSIKEEGPLRVVLAVRHNISPKSWILQNIVVTAANGLIDFDTTVEWHETHQILKIEFPVNVMSDIATYETQFGYIQRPTHYNTSWDLARFEVVGHRFADLSEYGFGTALLNDCKYGYSTKGNVMRMSLLRAPTDPDPDADRETHHFKYAFYAHKGSFLESNVIETAYQYNVKPTLCLANSWTSGMDQFFAVNSRNLVLDTIKQAEDPRGAEDGLLDVVLRLYETYGGRGEATINSAFIIRKANFCNILEDLGADVNLAADGRSLKVSFTPFKLVSIRCLVESRRPRM